MFDLQSFKNIVVAIGLNYRQRLTSQAQGFKLFFTTSPCVEPFHVAFGFLNLCFPPYHMFFFYVCVFFATSAKGGAQSD
jgi:hypothetical protein